MMKSFERFVLKNRRWCEFPRPDGQGLCNAKATRVVTIMGRRWNYQAAVCDDCARYVENERLKREQI